MSDLVNAAQKLSGPSVFEEGVVLFIENKILFLNKKGNQVFAVVEDEDSFYRVGLTRSIQGLEGACSCPASEDFDFCKHCVATALHLNKQEQELRALRLGSPKERVRALVTNMDGTECKDALLQVISSNKDLQAEYELRAEASIGELKVSSIKKRVNKALPMKTVSQLARVEEYFRNGRDKLSVIFELCPLLNPERAFNCAEYLLLRYDTVLGRIDDPNSYRQVLFEEVRMFFVSSFKALQWGHDEKIDYLFGLYQSDYSHFEFKQIPNLFIEKTDVKLLDAFRIKVENFIKRHGINRRKATGQIDSQTRNMISSISYCYLQVNKLEKAQEWLLKAADSVEGFIPLIELTISHRQFEATETYLDNAKQFANTNYEHHLLETFNQRFRRVKPAK